MNELRPSSSHELASGAESVFPAGRLMLQTALNEWMRLLGEEINHSAVDYVVDFLNTQFQAFVDDANPGQIAGAAKGAGEEGRDAIVGFAFFLQDYLRLARQSLVHASENPPPAPASNRSVARASSDQQFRMEMVGRIEPMNCPQATQLSAAITGDVPEGMLCEVWSLLALLRVYFDENWEGAKDLLQELAYRAGEKLHSLVQRLTPDAPAAVLQSGCWVVNSNAQFRQQFECRQLPLRCGYDSRYCLSPEGQRTGGNTVIPLSFYIAANRSGQICRKARVLWA
jgi:hypothetical protein